jgi:hypothetical protein
MQLTALGHQRPNREPSHLRPLRVGLSFRAQSAPAILTPIVRYKNLAGEALFG